MLKLSPIKSASEIKKSQPAYSTTLPFLFEFKYQHHESHIRWNERT